MQQQVKMARDAAPKTRKLWLGWGSSAIVAVSLLTMQAMVTAAVTIWLGRGAASKGDDLAAMIARTRPAVVSVLVDQPQRIFFTKGSTDHPRPRGATLDGLKPHGAGFVVDAAGHIVTNAHVVRGALRIAVRLHDGRMVAASIVGLDPRTDLAVLRVETANLPAPIGCFAERAPPVGARIVAIGDPFGLAGSASAGIVSAHGRPFGDVDPIDYIQHDAAVNKGSSGGPLLDEFGCLVGVNTAIPDETWANAGIAFALPTEVVQRVFDAVLRDGQPRRAFLGAGVQQIDPALAALFGVDAFGLLVTEVEPESPAKAAGLSIGDVLTAIDNVELARVRDLSRALLWASPDTPVSLRVRRGDTLLSLELVLGARNEPIPIDPVPVLDDGPERATPRGDEGASEPSDPLYGLRFNAPLPPAVAKRARLPSGGAILSAVIDGSAAAEMGLKAGDIILAVGREPIKDIEHLRQLLAAAAGKPTSVLVLRPGDRRQYVVIGEVRTRTTPGGNVPVIGGPF